MNWLEEFVTQHSELESPRSFWFWSALAAVSAVVKDQVWIDRQIYNLYPNIYCMLHADSGLKKGPPISAAKQLVKPVNNTRIISGRSSIQGILKEMGTAYTQPGGKIVNKSVAFICSSELSSSIVEDKVATKILTDLYDRQYNIGEWKSLLKMESFELKNPTVTMLTATNEAMSEDFFTRAAIAGGYFARTFIIYEKEAQGSHSLTYPLSHPPNYPKAAEYLKEVAKLSGPFHPIASLEKSDEYKFKQIKQGREIWFNKTGIIYEEWYENFKQTIKTQEVEDKTGTLNRFGDSVLKVAMLLSLVREPRLIIPEEAINEAIVECEKLIGNVRKTTYGKQGISDSSAFKSLIIMELLGRDNHQISRTMLMKKFWMHYSTPTEFDETMQSFDASGMIKTQSIGNQITYIMPDQQVTDMKKFMAGKSR